MLYRSNEAVRGQYVLGWSVDPQLASCEKPTAPRKQVIVWHMNYHPDGGQLFYPVEKTPFVFPVAVPGDDLDPEKVIALWCDGTRGLYIHPDIWHEGIFPLADAQSFLIGRAEYTPGSAVTSDRSLAFIFAFLWTGRRRDPVAVIFC